MALGTSPNPLIAATTPGLETNRWGCVVADDHGTTTRDRLLCRRGRLCSGAATVILAMGAGRKAAAAIDEYLRNK